MMQEEFQGKVKVLMLAKMEQKITWNQMRVASVQDNCQAIIWTRVTDKDATLKNVSFTLIYQFTYILLIFFSSITRC